MALTGDPPLDYQPVYTIDPANTLGGVKSVEGMWLPPAPDQNYVDVAAALSSLDPKTREQLIDMLEPKHAARILKALMRDAGAG